MGETRDLLKILNEHMTSLTIQDADDEDITLAALGSTSAATLVGNPANATNQRQKRLQPNSMAPTSIGYKAHAKKQASTRKASEKTAQFKNQGKNVNGKDAY
jgi:hypothetical protein